ncbi:unnamed protein product [Ectocarpus sp. 13 AM-2016]
MSVAFPVDAVVCVLVFTKNKIRPGRPSQILQITIGLRTKLSTTRTPVVATQDDRVCPPRWWPLTKYLQKKKKCEHFRHRTPRMSRRKHDTSVIPYILCEPDAIGSRRRER